ncbi:unnamed protein product [Closterium sp. Yama58-4]|nr:unnamed protein product [Closterium sp. Yama58-4]
MVTWGFDDSVLYGTMRLSDVRSVAKRGGRGATRYSSFLFAAALSFEAQEDPIQHRIQDSIQSGGRSGLGCETTRGELWMAGSGARRGVVAHARRTRKDPQPDKLMDGVEQLVDDYDIEKVASANQLSADDVAAGELSLDCNRFLIARSMINDRVSDHEEGITWQRSAPRLLWVARERRAEADAVERQRRRGEK